MSAGGLAKPGCEETTPFGPDVLVYKVGGKMFALTNPSSVPSNMNLKCDPDRAVELREEYEAVIPGYHENGYVCNGGATLTHFRESRVARCIQEGDLLAT